MHFARTEKVGNPGRRLLNLQGFDWPGGYWDDLLKKGLRPSDSVIFTVRIGYWDDLLKKGLRRIFKRGPCELQSYWDDLLKKGLRP